VVDWESNGRVKLDRAREHIQQLDVEIGAFLRLRPYGAFQACDLETRDMHWIAHVETEPPLLRWSAIASDAIHNLRVALDFLWLAARRQHKKGGASAKRQSKKRGASHSRKRPDPFPICEDESEFRGRFLNSDGTPKSRVADALVALTPYQTVEAPPKGSVLWELARIDNDGKHELLTLVGHASIVTVDPMPGWFTIGFRGGGQVRFPSPLPRIPKAAILTKGLPVHTVAAALVDKADMNPQIAFTISLQDARVPPFLPVVNLLLAMADDVQRAADVFAGAGLIG
jgi:hypothetical protein